jgi:starch synthase
MSAFLTSLRTGLGPRKNLKILFVGSEAAPFARVGGLASVMHSLPKALAELGYDARIMLPRYLNISDKKFDLKMEFEGLKVPTGNEKDAGPEYLICNVKRADPSEDGGPVTSYFLENQEYYEQRANVYGYVDDPIRFALLSRGCLEFLRQSAKWVPDVIVAMDWQCGFIPNYLKTVYAGDHVLSRIAVNFSIHNLFFQSNFDHRYVAEMDYDDGHSPIPGLHNPRLERLNMMRRGIIYSDTINTVSPNYAREIMTKEYGELLDDLLRERRAVLSGILNGIDYDISNPKTNPHIPFQFDATSLSLRARNKVALQEQFGLPINKDAFLIVSYGRLSRQKGLDLLYPIADTLLNELPIQLIVMGEGESDIMGFFTDLQTRHKDKVALHLKYDAILPPLLCAGGDAIIVPSRFEPCGLVQMEAMRLGCVPIVRKTGGLADSVDDYDPDDESGTGFVFERFDSSSLMIAIVRAYENFRHTNIWEGLQERAMKKDFSWKTSAKKYAELFSRAIKIHERS